MKRREFLTLSGMAMAATFSGCGSTPPSESSDAPKRPNIVVVMVDDMGFSDIGCYGGEAQTPTIDALAKNGLRFTQFYNAARCCPTRASLLTGLYPHKTGMGFMTARDFKKPGYRADINRQCLTIAEVLRPAGYQTYMAGKWHICHNFAPDGPKDAWPSQRGFDRFYGTLIAAGSQWNPPTLMEGNTPVEATGDFHYTEAMTDKAMQFIREGDAKKPFFLYLAYTAPHWPLHARERDIKKYRGRYKEGWDAIREARRAKLVKEGILDPKWKLSPLEKKTPAWDKLPDREWEQSRMEAFTAMIDHVDQNVGRLVAQLKERGELDNTLILFLSDNGGDAQEHMGGMIGATGKPWAYMRYVPLYTKDKRPVIAGDVPGIKPGPDNTYAGYGIKWANISNTPFNKYKKYAHEGGISTPLVAHWPAGISAKNELRRQCAHVIDVMATCVDVSGADYPKTKDGKAIHPLDGTSLLPIFAGKTIERDTLCWEHQGNYAIRKGDWKLVSAWPDNVVELYNMKDDRTETTNLAGRYPEKVKAMQAEYDAWAKKSWVLPWKDLNASIIAPKNSPLVRSDAEVAEYYESIKKAGLEKFVPDYTPGL